MVINIKELAEMISMLDRNKTTTLYCKTLVLPHLNFAIFLCRKFAVF